MTLADAITAHEEALTFGGRSGITSLHLIESAIARPYSGYHFPIANKAAALLQAVIQNRGFVDANKRTAWLLIEILIARSDYVLSIPDDEPIDDLVVAVAERSLNFDQLRDWFRDRLEKAPPLR